MKTVSLSFLECRDSDPALGERFRLDIDKSLQAWFGHPDPNVDIAICPLDPLVTYIRQHHKVDIYYRAVSNEMIPTDQQLAELDAVESVTFIGYPNGVWDSKNFLPVVRRGITASPLEVDFEGKPCFLIDASVFGGSSGSPVFILNQGSWALKDGSLVPGFRLHFIGVVASVYSRTDLNQIIPVPIPTQVQPMALQVERIDLGTVFKARTVVETIEAFREKSNPPINSTAVSIASPQS